MKIGAQKLFLRAVLITTVSFVASCSSGPRSHESRARAPYRYCDARLEGLESSFSGGIAALSPWLLQRALASGEIAFSSMEMAPQDQKSWADWAGQRLTEIHERLDEIPLHGSGRAVRKELSDAGIALVTFTGYSLKGQAERMVKTLEGARLHVWRARELACNIE